MKDRGEIIPLLHTLRRPTFFTRDHDFYKADLRHLRYCLVFLDVAFDEAAEFIRRFLRHTAFRTQAQRMGRVVRVQSQRSELLAGALQKGASSQVVIQSLALGEKNGTFYFISAKVDLVLNKACFPSWRDEFIFLCPPPRL